MRATEPGPAILVLIGLLLLCVPSDAADGDASWLALPFVFYSPDTEFGAGVALGYFIDSGLEGRPNSIQTAVTYTQREQFSVGLIPEFYVDDGRWLLKAELSVREYPDVYYGIGPGTSPDDEETYTSRRSGATVTALRRVARSLLVGLRADTVREDPTGTEIGGSFDNGEVTGGAGGTEVGLGPIALWDTRDNALHSMAGSYVELLVLRYDEMLGGDNGFTRAVTDIRHFVPVTSRQSVGLQLYTETTSGEPPFFATPVLGGDLRMRGYLEGRFRDNVHATVQAEHRFPIWRWIKGAAFVSAGTVAPSWSQMRAADVRYAGGAGFRLQLNDEGFHVRVEYARGEEDGGVYFTAREAF